MKNNEPKKITVFKNKVSLIDFIDYLSVPNKETGKLSDKLCIIINNYGQTHAQKFASFYIDREEVKILAYDLFNGLFKTNIYAKEKAKYTKFGGGKYSRILAISYESGYYTFTITISEAVKGFNNTVKPGKQIDQHTIKLDDFTTRKLFKTVHDYIFQKELVMKFQGLDLTTENEDLITEEPEEKTPEKTEEETSIDELNEIFDTEIDDDLKEELVEENDPVLPSGKNKGKKLSEMNDAYKKWILENAKGQQWENIKKAIKIQLNN